MSFRKELFQQYKPSGKFSGFNYMQDMDHEEIKRLFYEILNSGIHGFCYSIYEEGQGPGDIISEEQIRRRLTILKDHSQWVRTFSCIEGNELIPKLAKEFGMSTLVGAWLGDDHEKNEQEITNLIDLCNKGLVDIAAVGNEVLYRNDMSKEELIEYMRRVKDAVDVPVGYVDAYYEFTQHPEISELSDVILCNCYPYWEGTSYEDSLQHIQHMYNSAKQAGNGKRTIITETGWPSQGESLGGAIPSKDRAMKYFINTNLWTQDEDIEIFYFASFDEDWKKGAEGEVGAYWGVWDSKGVLKY